MHFTLDTPLCTPHFTLYTRQFALYICTLHSALRTPHLTLDTLHSTLTPPHSTLYMLQFHLTLDTHTLHFTLRTLHALHGFTLCTPHFTLDTSHSTIPISHNLHIPHSALHPNPNTGTVTVEECTKLLKIATFIHIRNFITPAAGCTCHQLLFARFELS